MYCLPQTSALRSDNKYSQIIDILDSMRQSRPRFLLLPENVEHTTGTVASKNMAVYSDPPNMMDFSHVFS